MTIARIEIYQCPIRLHEPFVISLGPMTHAENVVVVITTDTGIKGYGECSPIPLMADESLSDHHDAKRLIDLEACQLFNLKLGKSGGIFKALKIIELAEKAGIGMQVGGFLESRLAFTASAHLATASGLIKHFDFDSPMMIEADPVGGGITYGENGLVRLPDTPGLGAWVHEEFLRELERVVVE